MAMGADVSGKEVPVPDGLLLPYGWGYICSKCGKMICIASDNFVPIWCSKCGGEMSTPTKSMAKKRGFVKPQYANPYIK